MTYIYRVGFCTFARSTGLGNAKASERGTSERFDSHAFLFYEANLQALGVGLCPTNHPRSLNNLLTSLKNDCDDFCRNQTKIFANELDFQIELVLWLKSRMRYDEVHVEYYVPDLHGLVNVNSYIDIVIKSGGQFAAIELKYFTKSITGEFPLFGIKEKRSILRNKGAQNINSYNYWRDVKRIELLKDKYPNVVGGLVIAFSNDPYYYIKYMPGREAGYSAFCLHDGRPGAHDLKWGKISEKTKSKHPDLTLKGTYSCNWESPEPPLSSDPKNIFKYLITVV